MIERVDFKNFKALRDASLPLSQFTLIVGANGSGKSTGLAAMLWLRDHGPHQTNGIRTVGVKEQDAVHLRFHWREENQTCLINVEWRFSNRAETDFGTIAGDGSKHHPRFILQRARLFSLEANAIAEPVQLQPNMELAPTGANLAGVLDRLRDQPPERFENLNQELTRWLPEFDQILFDTPGAGQRALVLRTREGHHQIKAADLSQGTLIALALLTLAYMPQPPSIVCLEEPDRGLHPRLLRDVRDALYRLAHPEGAHETREPVQVIATTHNPYFLDLFREHPEEIVIAEKVGLEAKFSRLSDRKDLDEILADAPLSEVWYSGVLGGVPAGT